VSTAPAIVHSAREQWRLARREHVTASDCAAILGVDPRRGPLSVYSEKLGLAQDGDSIPARWGRRMQEAIVLGYREETGRFAEDRDPYELLRHPDLKWLGATLDATTAGSQSNPAPVAWEDPATSPGNPLEIKAMGEWRREARDEEIPLPAQCQVQVQMACARASWGSVAAFVGITKPVLWADLPRNDAFLAAALPVLERFRQRVLARDPDPAWADSKPSTAEAIKRLWPGENGKTVALDGEANDLMDALERARAQGRESEKAERAAVAAIRLRMGEASFGGPFGDGSYIRQHRVGREAYEVAATSYVTVSRWRPKVRRGRRA
jgi:putative phage-type endonuclease